MKHLALIWSEGSLQEMQKFDFLFHICLKNVRKSQSIEHMIIEQHKGLSGNSVQLEEITTILDGPTSRKILLLLDGYDEYKPGTNTDIDTTITRCSLRNCSVIITSRETNELPKIRQFMDAEAEITGFDKVRVEEYITKYLGSTELCQELLEHAHMVNLANPRRLSSLETDVHFSNTVFDLKNDLVYEERTTLSDMDAGTDEYGDSESNTLSERTETLSVSNSLPQASWWERVCCCTQDARSIQPEIPFQNLELGTRSSKNKFRTNSASRTDYETSSAAHSTLTFGQEPEVNHNEDHRLSKKDHYGILCIPILLHMICVLFLNTHSLPSSRTKILSAIVERCSYWERIRETGKKKLKDMTDTLVRLGQFVLTRMHAQIFEKVKLATSRNVTENRI